MDQKGFLITMDTIFGLLITFILIITVINIFNTPFNSFSNDIISTDDVQDVMEIMATQTDVDGQTILGEMTNILISQNNSGESIKLAGFWAGKFLNETAPGMNYNLTENRNLHGISITSNGQMKNATNINCAIRNYGNYTFQLYFWK
ncbi:MAG: hypothetical protein Q8M06_09645 [Methanobacteriaceae archaeon]|nr:hypothetical protein [Methanobacteriaceae archaeon]